jgi:hypothetical protein
MSRGTQIPECVLQGCLAAFKSRNRPSLFVLKSRTETDARKEDSVIFVLRSDLPHFRCRLGGSTRRKSLYPSSLGTVYRSFGRSRFSGSAVRGLMYSRMLNGLALRNSFEGAPKVRKIPQIADFE